MKSRILTLLTCIVLVASLFGGPSLDNAALAMSPVSDLVATSAHSDAAAARPGLPLAPTAVNSPSLITIPFIQTVQVSVNGSCDKSEYGGAAAFSFADGTEVSGNNNGTVYLMTDGSSLYVCMVGTTGTLAARFGALYLDPQGNGSSYVFAQQDDFQLTVNLPDLTGATHTTYRGNGAANGYTPDPTLNPVWSGVATTGISDQVEYKIPLKDFNLNSCYGIFGLAVYHHWFAGTGNDYGWPSNQWFDQPRTWQLATLGSHGCGNGTAGKIAYVYRGNTLDAASFYSLLTGASYTVDLVPLSAVLTTDFSLYDLIVIADDTGSLDQWGSSGLTASQVAKIANPSPGNPVKPIIGLGEGGYAFFGHLSMSIGWPLGWHGPQDHIRRNGGVSAPYFNTVLTVDPVPHYLTPTNSVGIYIPPQNPPAGVSVLGLEDPLDDHASLTSQNCRWLWGNSGNPLGMTGDGKTIFLNTVSQARIFQCDPVPNPPPPNCYTINKSVLPNSPVIPGTVLAYTLSYDFTVGANCPISAKLVDVVPFGTTFVPGSASDGISPAADGSLTWLVSAADPLAHIKSFKVIVSDSVCAANKLVANTAELRPSGFPPVPYNTVTTTVTCPTIGLPNTEPMYAETELAVAPYPLRAGTITVVSVRVSNLTASPQPVSVQFQSSPAQFGIGLAYTTFINAAGTVPASGSAVLSAHFIPTVSGNTCIQAAVSAPGLTQPLITQICLDVTEDLSQRAPATLTVPVRNNTAHDPATISLVVDNTCPGWSASITTPISATLSLAAGASSPVTVTVTPPTVGLLGTGCHIDLQAWDVTDPTHPALIGGVRKLDVPPVHLPLNIQPPWEEPEITFNPDPPVAGVPGQLCIQLANPLAVSKTVTVDFSVADFGAGMGFTPATTLTVTLPPNSIATYCVSWTPITSGTLHRCILATLKQPGYQDQHSQHNVDIVRPSSANPGGPFPFTAGNPDLTGHTLGFQVNLVGINPLWVPIIAPLGGGVLPGTIPAGTEMLLQLELVPAVLAVNAAPPPLVDLSLGSQHSVEVSLTLDGVPSGGFTIQLEPRQVYLPTVRR